MQIGFGVNIRAEGLMHCFKNRTGPAGPTGSTGDSPVRLILPKPVNNRSKTGKPVKNRAKTGVEPEIKKKTV